MKCNNQHCKYFIAPKKNPFLRAIGFKNATTEGGCKFPYCKKDKKKRV